MREIKHGGCFGRSRFAFECDGATVRDADGNGAHRFGQRLVDDQVRELRGRWHHGTGTLALGQRDARETDIIFVHDKQRFQLDFAHGCGRRCGSCGLRGTRSLEFAQGQRFACHRTHLAQLVFLDALPDQGEARHTCRRNDAVTAVAQPR